MWGAATAAYQVEGAPAEDGKGRSIWDTFTHQPGRITHGDTGDIACDDYHRFADDIALAARLNAGAYRFSISWPRIQPDGRGSANPAGLAHYSRVVDDAAGARDHAAGDALPLGPAAGAAGQGRLGHPGHR